MKTISQPDDRYLHKLDSLPFRPVFILGLHRSGTSILYKVLTATGCFNPVTAYHIIKYESLLKNYLEGRVEAEKNALNETFRKDGLEDRKVDGLKLSADFEEEYGFLLGRFSNKMIITPNNISLFRQMCRKILFISGNGNPILLKNPFDFTNFLFIKQSFPNAKFIFIHRHPLRTVSSNLNSLRMIFENRNPYTASISNIYEMFYSNPVMLPFLRFVYITFPRIGIFLITRFGAKSVKFYMNNIDKIPADDYITITYENFCRYPQKTIEHIFENLSLKTVREIDAQAFISRREAAIDDNVLKMRRFVYSSMKKYCELFHYSDESV